MIIVPQHSVNTATPIFTKQTPPKTNTPPNLETVGSQPPSATKPPPILLRARRDLQNPVVEPDPFNASVRQFADALVKQGDGQLAVSLGNALVRRQLASENNQIIGDPYKLAAPPTSTFGLAWSELADALESEPFKSFAESKLIDITQLGIGETGGLYEYAKDGRHARFSHTTTPSGQPYRLPF